MPWPLLGYQFSINWPRICHYFATIGLFLASKNRPPFATQCLWPLKILTRSQGLGLRRPRNDSTDQKAKCGIGVSPQPWFYSSKGKVWNRGAPAPPPSPLLHGPRIPHFGLGFGLASALDAARIHSLGCCVAGRGSEIGRL